MLSEEFKNFAPSIKIIKKKEEKEIYRTDIRDIPVIMSKTLSNTFSILLCFEKFLLVVIKD